MRSIEQFLKEGSKVFRRAAPDQSAIKTLLGSADGWVEVAGKKEFVPEIRVQAAYNAIHAASLAVINLLGYRVTSAQGHHVEAIEACCAAIGTGTTAAQDAMNLVRLRNDKYDGLAASEGDVESAFATMEKYLEFVRAWIGDHGKNAKPPGAADPRARKGPR